ncbi:hypothetical protein D3C72_2327000 [compost metagenome]
MGGLSLQPLDRPVFHQLRAGFGGNICRSVAILGEEAVRRAGETVPPQPGVDHQHLPACARELKTGGKPGVTAAEDEYVMGHIGPRFVNIVS